MAYYVLCGHGLYVTHTVRDKEKAEEIARTLSMKYDKDYIVVKLESIHKAEDK